MTPCVPVRPRKGMAMTDLTLLMPGVADCGHHASSAGSG